MSPPWLERVHALQREATLHRKRGDAKRKEGKPDDADVAYRSGMRVLDEALCVLLDHAPPCLDEAPNGSELAGDQGEIARELVETWGGRGGLLRRLGEVRGALESYRRGAQMEVRFVPSSTYNRVNAVKCALLSGSQKLSEAKPEIGSLEAVLSGQLAQHQELSDSGWSWADLGDCRALLGDVAGAESAYRTFVDKAASNAPKATLEVLRSIVAMLEESGDPGAAGVKESLQALERHFA